MDDNQCTYDCYCCDGIDQCCYYEAVIAKSGCLCGNGLDRRFRDIIDEWEEGFKISILLLLVLSERDGRCHLFIDVHGSFDAMLVILFLRILRDQVSDARWSCSNIP